jgi:nucleoside permease NupC
VADRRALVNQAASMLTASKTVLNEFVARLDFSRLPADSFSPRTRMILTLASAASA